MKKDVVPVQVMGVIPTTRGCAVFIGNDKKTFTIYVESSVGQAIAMFMQGTQKERPLTHDLIGHIFNGLGVSVERVVINDLKNGTYFARLMLKQDNELGKKIIEIDSRPSDCLALAQQAKAPIFVSKSVFDEVEDMSELLKKLNEAQESGGAEPLEEPSDSTSEQNLDIDIPPPESDQGDEGEDEQEDPDDEDDDDPSGGPDKS